MLDIPYKTFSFKDYTIEGFSRAAVQTFWRIPEFHLGFDLGAQPWSFMGTPNWFISHTHLDHIAFLPNYVARRRMMGMDPPRVFLPEKNVDAVAKVLRLWGQLDCGNYPCDLIGVKDGDTVELSREIVVEAHATVHRVPSLGFVVYHRRRKLLPELLELSGDEIRTIKESGKQIDYEIKVPKLAYLGDSQIAGLDRNEIFYKAETLIMEMTFVEDEHVSDVIGKRGHIHLRDVAARQEKFENELIIAAHFTARSIRPQIEECVRKSLPTMLDGRLKLWI